VALAKNIVSVVMYSNWFIEGLPSFKGDEFNVYRALKKYCHILLTMAISKYLVLHRFTL
jgi:hypothetical protein